MLLTLLMLLCVFFFAKNFKVGDIEEARETHHAFYNVWYVLRCVFVNVVDVVVAVVTILCCDCC